MILLVFDILLTWDATGEGMDPDTGFILSKVLSIDCFINFGFLALCCACNPIKIENKKRFNKINYTI